LERIRALQALDLGSYSDFLESHVADKRNVTRKTIQRSSERRAVSLPARLTWKDASGAVRFISVTTRDVSDAGVFVECDAGAAIPLFRLVHLQVERATRGSESLPMQLREGRVLSAVWRVAPCRRSTGTPSGYALRFLVEPPMTAALAHVSPLEAIAV
jgi:hypothetical protein